MNVYSAKPVFFRKKNNRTCLSIFFSSSPPMNFFFLSGILYLLNLLCRCLTQKQGECNSETENTFVKLPLTGSAPKCWRVLLWPKHSMFYENCLLGFCLLLVAFVSNNIQSCFHHSVVCFSSQNNVGSIFTGLYSRNKNREITPIYSIWVMMKSCVYFLIITKLWKNSAVRSVASVPVFGKAAFSHFHLSWSVCARALLSVSECSLPPLFH